MLARLVLCAVIARVNTAISIAGSASAAISISRDAPMPPKAVPTSIAASARKKRARGEQAGDHHDVGEAGGGQGHAQQGHAGGGEQGGREHHIGRGAKQRRGAVRHARLLGEALAQIAQRLDHGRAAPVLQPRLHLAHPAGKERPEQGIEEHLAERQTPATEAAQVMIHSSTSRVARVQPR